MAGKVATIVAEERYGRLTVVGRGGRDKHRHPLVECRCDCGRTTQVVLSKLRSTNPKQWTRSCGCLKTERFLAHLDKGAKKLGLKRQKAIFIDRCASKSSEQIALKYGTKKYFVDSANRLHQKRLKEHKAFPMIRIMVLAHAGYGEIGKRFQLHEAEVSWLAKQIRKEAKKAQELAQADPDMHYNIHRGFSQLSTLREIMKESGRAHFRGREWSLAESWRETAKEHVMTAYIYLDLLVANAKGSQRKSDLKWFLETMIRTASHRKDIRIREAKKLEAKRIERDMELYYETLEDPDLTDQSCNPVNWSIPDSPPV